MSHLNQLENYQQNIKLQSSVHCIVRSRNLTFRLVNGLIEHGFHRHLQMLENDYSFSE